VVDFWSFLLSCNQLGQGWQVAEWRFSLSCLAGTRLPFICLSWGFRYQGALRGELPEVRGERSEFREREELDVVGWNLELIGFLGALMAGKSLSND
jgi:hypothetical protein